MMMSDEECEVTLEVSDLEEIELDEYAETSDEEFDADDLASGGIQSDDDSATLTASSVNDSSDDDASESAGSLSLKIFPYVLFFHAYLSFICLFMIIP